MQYEIQIIMKRYAAYFTIIISVFSISSFAQTNYTIIDAETKKTASKFDDKSDEDLIIDSYLVVEVINMPFGKRTTKYEVSKLDMVYTNDLGPNNTRTVTPIYRKKKVRSAGAVPPKAIADASVVIQPVEVEVTAPAYTEKFVKVDILDTYANVLDKGYKSIEMLKKVADKRYFESDYEASAKYYAELISLDPDLEAVYYFRYVESLKAINQTDKANEAMLLFESKNVGNDVMKHSKVARN